MSNEWLRWEKVKTLNFSGHQLFRSSCPNYYKAKGDKSQNLTPTAVKYLVSEGIISFNEHEYDTTEKNRLKDAGTRYLWLPVIDYNAQMMDQLQKALKFHRDTRTPSRSSIAVSVGGALASGSQLYSWWWERKTSLRGSHGRSRITSRRMYSSMHLTSG